jgi:hypothetical protein
MKGRRSRLQMKVPVMDSGEPSCKSERYSLRDVFSLGSLAVIENCRRTYRTNGWQRHLPPGSKSGMITGLQLLPQSSRKSFSGSAKGFRVRKIL